MGGRDHSCEGCGRGGFNDPDGRCECAADEMDIYPAHQETAIGELPGIHPTGMPTPMTTSAIEVKAPSKEQARIRFDELARSVRDVDGVRVLGGYRRIHIGGLTISVVLRAEQRLAKHEGAGEGQQ